MEIDVLRQDDTISVEHAAIISDRGLKSPGLSRKHLLVLLGRFQRHLRTTNHENRLTIRATPLLSGKICWHLKLRLATGAVRIKYRVHPACSPGSFLSHF